MSRMGVCDQIKKAFQDLIAPELHAIRGDLRRLDQKIDGIDARLSAKIDGVDARLTTKIDALDQKIDSVKSEVLSEIRRSTRGSTASTERSEPRSTSANASPRSKLVADPDAMARRVSPVPDLGATREPPFLP